MQNNNQDLGQQTWYQPNEVTYRMLGLSRSQYMLIREQLLNPFKLSRDISQTQLSHVVNGREDVKLPDWADDFDFENEIVKAIDTYQVVWICPKCNMIVGFLEDVLNAGRGTLLLSLLFIGKKEKVGCPYCRERCTAFSDSFILKEGKYVDEKELKEVINSCSGSAPPAGKNEYLKLISDAPNELFLKEVLCRYHDQSGDYDKLYYRDMMTYSDLEKYGLGMDDYLYLRPSYQPGARQSGKKSGNVLGRVWDSVLLMTQKEWSDIHNVSVCMAASPKLHCCSYTGKHREMAIIPDYGLFSLLYIINKTFCDTIKKISSYGTREFEQQVNQFLSFLQKTTSKGIPPSILSHDPSNKGYGHDTKDEFWTIHILTNCQQQFILLHEVGHLMQGIQSACDAQRINRREQEADQWAMDIIERKGNEFYEPLIQFGAIFWLFEYWHLIMQIGGGWPDHILTPRQRFDILLPVIEKSGISRAKLDVDLIRHLTDNIANWI